jgi:uncharacterized protein (DUF427 family)
MAGPVSPPTRVEPGPGQESVWDYPRPPRVEPVPERIRVVIDGETIAESTRALRVLETAGAPVYYLPRDDVRMDLLTATDTTSHCPYKGDASYYSSPDVKDAFWVYENPSEEDAKPIAGLLAPWPGRVEVIVE